MYLLCLRLRRKGFLLRLLLLVSWVLAGGSAGCLIDGSLGALGEGLFQYSCADESDPYCDYESCEALGMAWCEGLETHKSKIPLEIARGSRFIVVASRLTWGGSATYSLFSASNVMLSSSLGTFVANESGKVAILATGPAGVMDFVYVTIAEPWYLNVNRMGSGAILPGRSLRLALGEEAWIRVTPHGQTGRLLGGALPCTWQVEAEGGDPVSIEPSLDDNMVLITGIALGSATLRVTLGDLSLELYLTVDDPEACVGECCVVSGCDPASQDRQCCSDANGQDLMCLVEAGETIGECVLPCEEQWECYWSTACQEEGHCAPVLCGDATQGWPGALDEACQVGEGLGGASGVCVAGPRTDPQVAGGFCLEGGTVPHGGACQVSSDPLASPRWVPQCAQGHCELLPGATGGICLGLCDWERHYDAAFHGEDATAIAMDCQPGWTCASSAHLDPVHGLRQPGWSRCLPTLETDSLLGVAVCSLVTGGLLSAPGTACASALAEPDAECLPSTVGLPAGVQALGTLLGLCGVPLPSHPPALGVWDNCTDPEARCPARTMCLAEGGLWGDPSGPMRCVPFCDAAREEVDNASCLDLVLYRNPSAEVEGTLSCVSVSFTMDDPQGGLLGGLDLSPSRLGVCQVRP